MDMVISIVANKKLVNGRYRRKYMYYTLCGHSVQTKKYMLMQTRNKFKNFLRKIKKFFDLLKLQYI